MSKKSHPRQFLPRKYFFAGILAAFTIIAACLTAIAIPPCANPPSARIHLAPKFVAGDSFLYRIETRTTTTSTATTPVVDPEAASKFKQTSNLQIRLDVVSVEPAAKGAAPAVHLRAKYEVATAVTESDAYDPSASALEDQFNRLQGRTMEFTIEPSGKISDITGLDDVLANPSTANAVRGWINGLASSSELPREGISIGQKWNTERPLENTPLANLLWRAESTYVRDEDCAPAPAADSVSATPAPAASPDATPQPCAVILTRFEILRHSSANSDPTPEDYRHNGLRTSGTWTGKGDSLDSISLQTGMIVRSTQTATQEMDFEIVSSLTGSKIHYVGHVETQSETKLIPTPPAAPASQP